MEVLLEVATMKSLFLNRKTHQLLSPKIIVVTFSLEAVCGHVCLYLQNDLLHPHPSELKLSHKATGDITNI